MKFQLLVVILHILTSGCGSTPSNYRLQEKLSKGAPTWHVLDTTNESRKALAESIYSLSLDGKHLGTGVMVGSSVLLTNAHVALNWKIKCLYLGCKQLLAQNHLNSFTVLEASVIDKTLDSAFLTLETKGENERIKFINPSYIPPQVGESIYTIGYLVEIESFVVSMGKIKNKNFQKTYKPYLGYNADSVPGMSGSPVFNSNDELIGLHFGKPQRSKYNRAIPIYLILGKYPQFFPHII